MNDTSLLDKLYAATIDTWPAQIPERIKPDNSWHRATHRMETGHSYGVTSLACNVDITGRKEIYVAPGDVYKVRGKITFPHDDDMPDTVCRGWLYFRY